MNRRTFSAAIAAFFGLGRAAKATSAVTVKSKPIELSPAWTMEQELAYKAFCDKTVTRLRKGLMVTLPPGATLEGFNP